MNTLWRLIDTGPLDGPANMAVDEALLRSFDPETTTPVLRLYGWKPPAFSLGRFQQAEEALDLERCAAARITVVRRITGGGLIYHAEELTYSIVCGERHVPGTRGVKESFRILCGFLLGAYRQMGLAASFAVDNGGGRLGERTPLCFAGREEYDILVEGKKLGGNAQRRRKEIIFQHGSIPLRNGLPAALPFLREVPPGFVEGAGSLAELGGNCPAELLKGLLVSSFQDNLGIEFFADSLSSDERETAEQLKEIKYCVETWNREGVDPCR